MFVGTGELGNNEGVDGDQARVTRGLGRAAPLPLLEHLATTTAKPSLEGEAKEDLGGFMWARLVGRGDLDGGGRSRPGA